jgi:hypothetical protein
METLWFLILTAQKKTQIYSLQFWGKYVYRPCLFLCSVVWSPSIFQMMNWGKIIVIYIGTLGELRFLIQKTCPLAFSHSSDTHTHTLFIHPFSNTDMCMCSLYTASTVCSKHWHIKGKVVSVQTMKVYVGMEVIMPQILNLDTWWRWGGVAPIW